MPLVECGHPSLKAEIGALGRKVETYDTTDHEHSGISSLRIEVTTLLLIINFKLRQLKTLVLLTPDYFSKLAHTLSIRLSGQKPAHNGFGTFHERHDDIRAGADLFAVNIPFALTLTWSPASRTIFIYHLSSLRLLLSRRPHYPLLLNRALHQLHLDRV